MIGNQLIAFLHIEYGFSNLWLNAAVNDVLLGMLALLHAVAKKELVSSIIGLIIIVITDII